MAQVTFGSISTGTHKPDDLITAFADELERLCKEERPGNIQLSDQTRFEHLEMVEQAREALEPDDQENLFDIVNELQDALGEWCPSFVYFGTIKGDGADFGFWPDINALEEAVTDGEVLKVSDTAEVTAENAKDIIMHVNDHGNVTLYTCKLQPDLQELWACV